MKIQIKTLTGKAITVKAELTDTIGVIKRKMAEKESIPPDQHNLMFAGEQLQDWHTLADYIEFVKRDRPLPKHYQTYDAVATQANHGFVFKKRTIKQVMEEEKKKEKEAATVRLQAAGRGMLGRAKAREEYDSKMEQVDAATKVQSIIRRRLDQHKIDDLVQQKRVNEIIADKEKEEKLREHDTKQANERQSIFEMILAPVGLADMVGGPKAEAENASGRKKEKRIAFTDLKKSDIPPDGKFWASGYFVYWSDKHNRPYFYNPEVDETQWFPPEEDNDDDDDIIEFSDEEEDMDESERKEHQDALKKAKLRRLRLTDQHKYRNHLVIFREGVRKADVLDTGYLSEELMGKLARNTGAIPNVEQQFFLAMKTCSRNHHGDVNHEDFNECFKITLGYNKLSFEERLENNQAIKEMDAALTKADIRFSGLLPEATIRRIGVEYGIHKMRLELAIIVSPRGLGDLIMYEEALPNLQHIINGYRPAFTSSADKSEEALKAEKEAQDANKSIFDAILPKEMIPTQVDSWVRRLSGTEPLDGSNTSGGAVGGPRPPAKDDGAFSFGGGDDDDKDVNDANVIADAVKRQAEHEEMAGAASVIQAKYRQKKAMNAFYAKMVKIYMDMRMTKRQDPNRRNVPMQILGANLDTLESYKVVFEKPEPLRLILKGVANHDAKTGITHDFVVVTGFSRKENGAMGPAELCGDIGFMDFLVGVQNKPLVGLTFNETMQHLRSVEYPLTLQFIRNSEMVPPDHEGWALSYFPNFGNAEFHSEVLKKIKKTTIFQTYPDNFDSPLIRRYLELRGSELSVYKVAKGGAINATRIAFMETSDVERVRRLKCWDVPETQMYQLHLLMKAAGGETIRLVFNNERDVDAWAVAIGSIADVTPSAWENIGDDPDEEYEEEVIEYKSKDELVQLKPGMNAKFGLQPGERCKVANVDPIKGVVYVIRLKDKRELGPFWHNDLCEAPDDYEVEVPEEGYRGSVLGYTTKMMYSEYLKRIERTGEEDVTIEKEGDENADGANSNAALGFLNSALGGTEDDNIFNGLGDGILTKRKFHFAPTERVLVLRFGNLWYNATVTVLEEETGTYEVLYDDGDSESKVDAIRLMSFSGYEFEVEDVVEVKRFGVKYYKAVVEGKNIGRPGMDPTYDIRYVDSDDIELMVEIGRIRVATGFIYNEKALRKLVPNRPRLLTGSGAGGGGGGDTVSKEILELQQQLARLTRNMDGGGGGGYDDDGRLDGPSSSSANKSRSRSRKTGGGGGGGGGGGKGSSATGWSDPNHGQGLGNLRKPGKPLKGVQKPVKGMNGGDNNDKNKKSQSSKSKNDKSDAVNKWDPSSSDGNKKKDEIHGIKIGSKFKKEFEGHGIFEGTVMSYSKEKKYFSVAYEDGDTEELKTDDLRLLMGLPPRKRKTKQ
jgi:ubiquitin